MPKSTKKYVSKSSFFSQKIFSKNFVAIHEIKPVLTLDKPVYVGFNILILIKLLMFEFHYKYVGTKYYNKAKLLFTGTNSLVYKTETDDVYEDICKNKYLFDFSNCPEDTTFFDPVNKKVIGKMKSKERIKSKLHRIRTYDVYKISFILF